MKTLRRLFNFLCILSLLAWLAFGFFRLRSRHTTDICMMPLPSGNSLLITSHRDNYLQLTLLKDWPVRRFAWFSGPGWRNVGPFRMWQMHRWNSYNPSFLHLHPLGEYGFWRYEGSYVVPRSGPNQPPEFNRSYDRARALEPVLWGSPDWYFGYAREINMPFRILIRWSAVLPLVWLVAFLLRRRRQRRRVLEHMCLNCGYDLRASKDKCPECGEPIPSIIISPPSPPQTPPSPASANPSPAPLRPR